MKKLFTTIALAALVAAGMTGLSEAAKAQDGSGASASVRVGDLNLATPAGQATLDGRLKAAANQVCGRTPLLPLRESIAVGECRAQLLRSADRQVALAFAGGDAPVSGTR